MNLLWRRQLSASRSVNLLASCPNEEDWISRQTEMKVARTKKVVELAAIEARREALRTELAQLDAQAKAVEQAARDAGRSTLLAALDRVKIAGLSKNEARTIANAIARHSGKIVAEHLTSLD
jgi:hypothetical protein